MFWQIAWFKIWTAAELHFVLIVVNTPASLNQSAVKSQYPFKYSGWQHNMKHLEGIVPLVLWSLAVCQIDFTQDN